MSRGDDFAQRERQKLISYGESPLEVELCKVKREEVERDQISELVAEVFSGKLEAHFIETCN